MSAVHMDTPVSNRCWTGRRSLAPWVMALAVWGLIASTVHAQNPYTWNNGTTQNFSGNWNVAGNWRDAGNSPGVPPSSATTELAFAGNGNYISSNDIGNFTLNRLTSTTSGQVMPDGSQLLFDGASPLLAQTVANDSFNISNNIRLLTDTTFRATNGSVLNIGTQAGGQINLNGGTLMLEVGANSTIVVGRVGVNALIGDVEGNGAATITGANNTDARVIITGDDIHAGG